MIGPSCLWVTLIPTSVQICECDISKEGHGITTTKWWFVVPALHVSNVDKGHLNPYVNELQFANSVFETSDKCPTGYTFIQHISQCKLLNKDNMAQFLELWSVQCPGGFWVYIRIYIVSHIYILVILNPAGYMLISSGFASFYSRYILL